MLIKVLRLLYLGKLFFVQLIVDRDAHVDASEQPQLAADHEPEGSSHEGERLDHVPTGDNEDAEAHAGRLTEKTRHTEANLVGGLLLGQELDLFALLLSILKLLSDLADEFAQTDAVALHFSQLTLINNVRLVVTQADAHEIFEVLLALEYLAGVSQLDLVLYDLMKLVQHERLGRWDVLLAQVVHESNVSCVIVLQQHLVVGVDVEPLSASLLAFHIDGHVSLLEHVADALVLRHLLANYVDIFDESIGVIDDVLAPLLHALLHIQ